eukprot:scaffold81074_cov70-Phaeocystis_antarctica.AAC.5
MYRHEPCDACAPLGDGELARREAEGGCVARLRVLVQEGALLEADGAGDPQVTVRDTRHTQPASYFPLQSDDAVEGAKGVRGGPRAAPLAGDWLTLRCRRCRRLNNELKCKE